MLPRIIIFTNEHNLDLAEAARKNIVKYTREICKVDVVSNYGKESDLVFSSNVTFCHSGSHFSETLLTYLHTVDEEFIFLFCDDYFLLDYLLEEDLKQLMNFITAEGVDYFGFDDIAGEEILNFEPYADYFIRDRNYRYLFSVQPAIWKKKSLKKILSDFPKLNLHQLDETIIEIKESNNYLCLCTDKKSHFSFDQKFDNFFIFPYVEVVRHGVFHLPENGFSLSDDYLSVKFIKEPDSEYNFMEEKYKKFWIN